MHSKWKNLMYDVYYLKGVYVTVHFLRLMSQTYTCRLNNWLMIFGFSKITKY